MLWLLVVWEEQLLFLRCLGGWQWFAWEGCRCHVPLVAALSSAAHRATAHVSDWAGLFCSCIGRRLVSISELCCVKCVSQPCSAKCADEFLPFHDQCRGRPAYVALMPLGGGSVRIHSPSVARQRPRRAQLRIRMRRRRCLVCCLPEHLPMVTCLDTQLDDFESLAVKCKDPSVIAERHHARSGLTVARGGLNGLAEGALARLEQRQATMESQLQQMKADAERASSGGASAGQSAAVSQLQGQVAELVKTTSQQDGIIRGLQNKVAALETQLAARDAAAAAAAAAAAELVAAGAD